MDLDETTYFTGADAEIMLSTHPDEEWRGQVVDCAFFRLTAGSSPVHIWNYTRREGPAMGNAAQRERQQELQTGVQSGAPFDDTAISNARFELQLILNEDRFKSTYHSFRAMSEVGNVEIRYAKQSGWEDRVETGYVLADGRVGSVGREVNVRDGTYPAVELQFADMYRLSEERPIYTQNNTPPSHTRGGPGVGPEYRAVGLGQTDDEPVMRANYYGGRVDGRTVRPRLFKELPETVNGYDMLWARGSEPLPGPLQAFIKRQRYITPVLALTPENTTRVFVWNLEHERYVEDTSSDPVGDIERLLENRSSTLDSDATPLPR